MESLTISGAHKIHPRYNLKSLHISYTPLSRNPTLITGVGVIVGDLGVEVTVSRSVFGVQGKPVRERRPGISLENVVRQLT